VQNNKQLFSEQWAIILGGSSGFGFAAVQKLALHGMNIAILYRETAAAERTLKQSLTDIAAANNVTIEPYNVNALDGTARTAFIEKFISNKKSSVKLLLHSIARGNLKSLTGDDALSMADIQLTTYAMGTSLLDWTRDLLAANAFNNDARIIGLTSEGEDKYWEGYAAVSIAKAAYYISVPHEQRGSFSMADIKMLHMNQLITKRIFSNLAVDLTSRKIKSIYNQCLNFGRLRA